MARSVMMSTKLHFTNGRRIKVGSGLIWERKDRITLALAICSQRFFSYGAMAHPEEPIESFGRCLIENPEVHACAPDLVIYQGDGIPQWQAGEPRRIDLSKHRIPDLVGEIADTSLSQDLDEQKHLYASLGIPEYWVIDVQGLRIFAFALDEAGEYQLCDESRVLEGLSIGLIQQTLQRLETMTNTAAANWFMQQLQGEE